MKKRRIIIALVILAVLSITSYLVFRKPTIESAPERATLVLLQYKLFPEEVDINAGS